MRARTPVTGQASLWFGGDYNPEQWPDELRATDLDALERLSVNTVTVGIFSWALIHPAKDTFDLGWLERVVDDVAARGIGVVLATPTAAQPAWLSAAFPEILPVDASGNRRRHGGRVNYCPSSTVYREASAEIAGVLAERFGGHDALRLWHVNNEYGPVCYCDRCLDGFRRWVAERYLDLSTVNEAWGTNVWGNTLTDWSEIELPSVLNAMEPATRGRVRFAPSPSIALDHARFCSAVLLECFLNEQQVLYDRSPGIPVTTNFHGPVQVVDWHEWATHVDLVAWDSYPLIDGHWSHASFGHDLARGAGTRREFLIMEAAPGAVSWHDRCALKAPGRVRLEALQAVAHGSRGMLYFQIRQARAGAELNHSALIPRSGRLDTRAGAELIRLGSELPSLGVLPDTHEVAARIAVIFDWASWWGHHNTPGLDQRSRYLDTVRDTHRALVERGRVVDVIASAGPFDRYEVVVAPLLHVVAPPAVSALTEFVDRGGVLITTTGSGIVDTNCQVHPTGTEPAWRRLLGLWIEETDTKPPDIVNRVRFDDGTIVEGRELFDIVRPESAVPIAEFEDDFFAGAPAVTTNDVGDGTVVYIACLAGDVVAAVVERLLDDERAGRFRRSATTVEVVTWRSADSEVVFLLNHGNGAATVSLDEGPWTDVWSGTAHSDAIVIPGVDAAVLRRAV